MHFLLCLLTYLLITFILFAEPTHLPPSLVSPFTLPHLIFIRLLTYYHDLLIEAHLLPYTTTLYCLWHLLVLKELLGFPLRKDIV